MRTIMTGSRRWLLGVALGLACLGTGCQQEPATGSVRGTVTTRGKAVPTGYVILHAPDGRMFYGSITRSGAYTIPSVPAGTVRVSLGGMSDTLPAGSTAPGVKDRPAVPVKYYKPATSDLEYTIAAGSQQIDVRAD